MVDFFNESFSGRAPAHAALNLSEEESSRTLPSSSAAKSLLALGAALVLVASVYGYFLVSFHNKAFERFSEASATARRAFELTSALGNLEHAEQRFAETGLNDEFVDVRRILHNTMLALTKILETEQNEDAKHLLGQLALRLDDHHNRMMNSKPDADGLRDRTLFDNAPIALLYQPLQNLSTLSRTTSDEAEADFKQTSTQMWFAIASVEVGLVIIGVALFIIHRRRVRGLAESRLALSGDNHRLRTAFDTQAVKLDRVETLFKSSLSASNMTMFIQDTQLAVSWIHNPKFGTANELIGRRDEQFMPLEASLQTVKTKMKVIESGIGTHLEYSYHHNGQIVDKWMQIDPIFEQGKVIGIIGVALDVTERRMREAKIEALASELVHRNQNLLAVVAATARRMIGTSHSLAEFEAGFSARLQAISRSFDLIVKKDWLGVPLDDLIRSQIAAVDSTLLDRVTLTGLTTLAEPATAEALGNAIYELTQNAMQHGAFSQPNGTVQIDWWVETDLFGSSQLFFVWYETDGTDHVPTISHRRFGLGMLEHTLPRALGGNASLVTYPGGIKWRMRCPWPDPVVQTREPVERLSV